MCPTFLTLNVHFLFINSVRILITTTTAGKRVEVRRTDQDQEPVVDFCWPRSEEVQKVLCFLKVHL